MRKKWKQMVEEKYMRNKANKLLCLCAVFFFFSKNGFSQNTEPEICGYDMIMKILEEKYPGFRAQYDRTYLELLDPGSVHSRKTPVKDTTFYNDTVFTIPIVYHVLYNTATENINDSLLYNQLEVLNQDYRRLNPDTGKTRTIFKSRAGDARLEFVLASTDPLGAPTTGIVRKFTNKTTFYTASLADMKYNSTGGDDAWDPAEYLNIWVCDMNFQGQDAILGFAYPPYGHPYWPSNQWVTDPNQGVVLHYKIVGRNNPNATGAALLTSKGGRVATHEVGHYLGLRHIWGDPQSGSGCNVDDYIFDTPNQGTRTNFDCPIGKNTCADDGDIEYPDMIENYMDYSAHACQNMFTNMQIRAMRGSLAWYRNGLPMSMAITPNMKIKDTFVYDKVQIFVSDEQRVIVEIRNEDLKEDLRMDVLDMTGQVIVKDAIINKNESWVNTANLSAGIYFFNLKKPDNKSIKIEKLLILQN